MKELKRKYLEILKIELEDLKTDTETLLALSGERKDRGEITNYVFLENMTLFKNLISGIEYMYASLCKMSMEKYNNLGEMIADIDLGFRQKTKDSDFPEAVYTLVKRKLEKVLKYILGDEK